jgi:alginate O-acetyltransferase complex protein AlgI
MIFSQIEFLAFFVAVFAGNALLPTLRLKHLFLLAASLYFYAYWDWRFCGLLIASSYGDFLIGRRIVASQGDRQRRHWMWASILLNLGVLGYFKYANFFIQSASAAFQTLGWHPQTLSIILPAGISFFTFQKFSYTIDLYRREIPPCKRFSDFLLFISFFPQLVAGPIVRASEFLPQLSEPRPLTAMHCFEGFRQFVFGFFKKVFIADRIAGFVDYSFDNAAVLSGGTLWLAVLSYTLQIYCDFSGYSDMAIGCARALGYDFRPNFNLPYIATSITEFWRRWHISLSTWLRDYLYIPLGGNRLGKRRTYINLMTTMLLGGLWHGASWTFVFWGGLHGVALAVHKVWLDAIGGELPKHSRALKLTSWAVTMLVVMLGWVFFRARDFSTAGLMLSRMVTLRDGVSHLPPFVFLALALMAVPHVIAACGAERRFELRHDRLLTPVVLLSLFALALLFYPEGFAPFIYFQF